MRIVSIAVVVVVIGSGCGSSGGGGSSGTLDCAWLAGDNCWKTTADDAVACLPPTTEIGVLSADNKTCTYTSGAQVTFTPALVLPAPLSPAWNFTITKGGADCLHFENPNDGFKLVVRGHTVTEARSGPAGIAVTCPDGTTYTTTNALALFNCGADGGLSIAGFPGDTSFSTSTSVSVGLLGTTNDSLPLFDCQR